MPKTVRLVAAFTAELSDGKPQPEGAVREAFWEALEGLPEIYPQDEDRADESQYTLDLTSVDILP